MCISFRLKSLRGVLVYLSSEAPRSGFEAKNDVQLFNQKFPQALTIKNLLNLVIDHLAKHYSILLKMSLKIKTQRFFNQQNLSLGKIGQMCISFRLKSLRGVLVYLSSEAPRSGFEAKNDVQLFNQKFPLITYNKKGYLKSSPLI